MKSNFSLLITNTPCEKADSASLLAQRIDGQTDWSLLYIRLHLFST